VQLHFGKGFPELLALIRL